MGDQTKRPHFVPACYLRAWADDADQVAVRRRGGAKLFTPNVTNVAVSAGLYGSGDIGQSRERLFGQIEAEWPSARAMLTNTGGTVGGHDRDLVSLFAALQLVRTREHVAGSQFLHDFADFSSRRPVEREDIRRFLAERHLRFPPSDAEVEGAWTLACVALNNGELPSRDETLAVSIDIAVGKLGPTLGRMHWSVEHCRKPMLLTSDRPVMSWRPPSPRDRYEGIGIETAHEVRLPLSPSELLVMRHADSGAALIEVQPRRFERVNRDVAAQCHEFVIATRRRARQPESVPLAAHRPVVRFHVGPGYQQRRDGITEPMGDIVHTWVPLRAVTPTRTPRSSHAREGRPKPRTHEPRTAATETPANPTQGRHSARQRQNPYRDRPRRVGCLGSRWTVRGMLAACESRTADGYNAGIKER